jgi:hypothetical protein
MFRLSSRYAWRPLQLQPGMFRYVALEARTTMSISLTPPLARLPVRIEQVQCRILPRTMSQK